MSPRPTAINFTVRDLQLIVNLLKRHVEVAQYEKDEYPAEFAQKMEKILNIAKELEPIS